MMNTPNNSIGRKVFFLFPERLLAQGLIDKVIRNQYEAYTLSRIDKIGAVMQTFPDSLFILDPMGASCPDDWKDLLQEWIGLPKIGDIRIYITLLSGDDEVHDLEYDSRIRECRLFENKSINTGSILRILDEAQAMGQRKFIRLGGGGVTIAECSVSVDGRAYHGYIHDISTAGLSCSFESNAKLLKGEKILSLNATLEGIQYSFSGEITLIRNINGESVYVIMYDRRSLSVQLEALRDFIYHSLQQKMNSIIEYL